jgi:hypothetical protein
VVRRRAVNEIGGAEVAEWRAAATATDVVQAGAGAVSVGAGRTALCGLARVRRTVLLVLRCRPVLCSNPGSRRPPSCSALLGGQGVDQQVNSCYCGGGDDVRGAPGSITTRLARSERSTHEPTAYDCAFPDTVRGAAFGTRGFLAASVQRRCSEAPRYGVTAAAAVLNRRFAGRGVGVLTSLVLGEAFVPVGLLIRTPGIARRGSSGRTRRA